MAVPDLTLLIGQRDQAKRAYVRPDWYLVSSHGAVLLFIVTHPGCTICEMADAMCLTQGTISNVIGDLRQAGMLRVSRDGRRNNYTVNLDAPLRLPGQRAFPLRVLVGDLVEQHTGEARVLHEPVRTWHRPLASRASPA